MIEIRRHLHENPELSFKEEKTIDLYYAGKNYNEKVEFYKKYVKNFDKTLNERDVLTQIKVNSAKYIRENLNLL